MHGTRRGSIQRNKMLGGEPHAGSYPNHHHACSPLNLTTMLKNKCYRMLQSISVQGRKFYACSFLSESQHRDLREVG